MDYTFKWTTLCDLDYDREQKCVIDNLTDINVDGKTLIEKMLEHNGKYYDKLCDNNKVEEFVQYVCESQEFKDMNIDVKHTEVNEDETKRFNHYWKPGDELPFDYYIDFIADIKLDIEACYERFQEKLKTTDNPTLSSDTVVMNRDTLQNKLDKLFCVEGDSKHNNPYGYTEEYDHIRIKYFKPISDNEIEFRFAYKKGKVTCDAMGTDLGAWDDYNATVYYSGTINGDEFSFKNDEPFSHSSQSLNKTIYLIDKYDSATNTCIYLDDEIEGEIELD